MISLQKARALRALIESVSSHLSDEEAITAIELFPHWKPGLTVAINERYFYDDHLYKVVQAHTTQNGWEPDITPALFTEIAQPGEIPVWKQPTGAQDAYMTGDKVYYPTKNDAIYVSIVDNNVWAPNVYGWQIDK